MSIRSSSSIDACCAQAQRRDVPLLERLRYLGASNSFGYSGSLSNFSSVEVKSGTVTLSGVSSYAGTTVLSGGSPVQLRAASAHGPQSAPDRRAFLKSAAAAAAVVPTLMGASATPALAHDGAPRGRFIPRESISIQLYTLRELNLDVALQGLAAIGYRRVEHAGFGKRTAAEFRAALQQAGLRASSGHHAIPQPWDDSVWYQQVADAVAVGQQSIVTPLSPITFFPPDGDISKIKGLTTVSAWQRYAEDFNRAGAIARAAGLRFGFHNHFWEFAALEDDSPLVGYDVLLAETDPRLVHFEVDLYWAWFARRDPVQLIAYAGDRIRHSMSRTCGLSTTRRRLPIPAPA